MSRLGFASKSHLVVERVDGVVASAELVTPRTKRSPSYSGIVVGFAKSNCC